MALKPVHIAGIAAAGAGAYLIFRNSDQLKKIQEALGAKVGAAGSGGAGTIVSGITDLSFLADIFKNIPQPQIITQGEGLFSNLKDSFENVGKAISGLDDKIKDVIDKGKDAGKDILDKGKQAIDKIADAPGKAFDTLNNKISDVKRGIDDKIEHAAAVTKVGIIGAGIGAGVSTVTGAPLVATIGVILAEIWGFNKLRSKTIKDTGKTPESIVGDFFKNLVNLRGPSGLPGLKPPLGPPELKLNTPNLVQIGQINTPAANSQAQNSSGFSSGISRGTTSITSSDLQRASDQLKKATSSGFITVSSGFANLAKSRGIAI
ncbi:hypothetical protein HYT53_03575 [Candidatus Woesearchaeota archaeon]|nr:hypothetical protein [Candidatus Woesearchaeota archaeon]